jgi:hypothetical protein
MRAMVITQLVDDNVVAMFDDTANKIHIISFRPNTGTSVLVGSISSADFDDYIHISEATIVNAGTLYAGITVVWTKSDRTVSKCYYARGDGAKLTTASLTQITDVDFPDQLTPAKVVTGPMVQMNGVFYVYTTDGIIYNSGGASSGVLTSNDPTVWYSGSKILTYQYPDGGIGIYRYKHHIVAVGTDSVEFFNDAGNPAAMPRLENTEQAFIRFGAISPNAVTNIDDNLYWLSNSSSNTVGLWRLDGYTPTKISSLKEDRFILLSLQSGFAIPRVNLFPFLAGNKNHLLITYVSNNVTMPFSITAGGPYFGNSTDTYYTNINNQLLSPTAALNLVYSIEDKVFWGYNPMSWSSCIIIPTVSYPGSSASSSTNYRQYVFVSNISNVGFASGSRVFYADRNSFVDANPDGVDTTSLPVCCVVQFNTLEFANFKRKRISKATLVFDEVPFPAAGDTGVYSISLFVSRGERVASSTRANSTLTERIISYPSSVNRYYYNNLGMSRRWDFCVVAMNKNSFFLKGLELSVEQGTH